MTHTGRQFVFVPGSVDLDTAGWNPQTIHIVNRNNPDDNHRIVNIDETITALRCNDTFAIASTAMGHLKIVSLSTGTEVFKSDKIWTDGGAAFDCCFGISETLICFGAEGNQGVLRVATFNNDIAAPEVKGLSKCDTKGGKMRCVTISEDGTMVACADEQGVYAYVASVGEAKVFKTFTRGSSAAKVLALRFSPRGEFLALMSDHGTCHLFGVAPGISNYIGFWGYVWSHEESKLYGDKDISRCAIGVDCNSDTSFKVLMLDSKLGGVDSDVLVSEGKLKFSGESKFTVTLN